MLVSILGWSEPDPVPLLCPEHSSCVCSSSMFHVPPQHRFLCQVKAFTVSASSLRCCFWAQGRGIPCHGPQLSLWPKRFETQGIYRCSSVPMWKILSKMSRTVAQNRKLLSRMHQRVNFFLCMYTYFLCPKGNTVKIRALLGRHLLRAQELTVPRDCEPLELLFYIAVFQ